MAPKVVRGGRAALAPLPLTPSSLGKHDAAPSGFASEMKGIKMHYQLTLEALPQYTYKNTKPHGVHLGRVFVLISLFLAVAVTFINA